MLPVASLTLRVTLFLPLDLMPNRPLTRTGVFSPANRNAGASGWA